MAVSFSRRGVHNVPYYGRHMHIPDDLAMYSCIVMIVVYITSKEIDIIRSTCKLS